MKELKKYRVAYLYIAPFFILFGIFGLFPIVYGLYLSFFRWDGMTQMHFIGIENYISIFKDVLFWRALKNTLVIGIIAHIPILLGGLALAFILNSKLIKGENIFKTIYFMPMVTSAVAISIVFQQMFGNNYGVINYFNVLLGGNKINWLGGDGSLIKVAVIVMFAWKWVGWNMVIYLAGMQGISSDIYEAASIDGASQTQVLFKICIPLLKPIIIFTVIQSTIGMFNLFTEPFILTNQNWNGGTNNGGLTLMMYLLNKAPQGGTLYGYASAVAYIITMMIVLISILVNKGTTDKSDPDYIAHQDMKRMRRERRRAARQKGAAGV
ncbi:carbohydrate ABC transporter permease [Porcincola intestinalis]|nr:sugar ABC transporter permease [Porcincola intestinalis]MCI6766645.1 sugar ABC transporter permease [Lachnospiraceae bacterium]MDD7060926.1 sugar ABC transporter permease [Porcincola intestinalis]MDY5283356.1 sugar ABC transporter permease [Porcincola intestinalis]MDY5578464.1 sugar ABC transporter permease [Porcincola intestinalis]